MFPRDEDQQRELMYKEQLRTNELLERLVDFFIPKVIEEENGQIELPIETKTTVNEPENTTVTNKQTRGKLK